MTSPLPFPDWVPWWVHVALLLGASFLFVLYFFLPFSVFGVKSRLEAIEARLDEIQGEIRSLTLRLPEASVAEADDYGSPVRPSLRPPIPPAAATTARTAAGRRDRMEPRLW